MVSESKNFETVMKKFYKTQHCDRCGNEMFVDNDRLIDKMTGEPSNLIRWKCPKCHCVRVTFKEHKKSIICRIIETLKKNIR